ncbi:MAG: hypothetical protein ABIK28_16305, partial [Planctomycetota bacterium]
MKLRLQLLLVALSLLSFFQSMVMAETATPGEMERVCLRFLNEHVAECGAWANDTRPWIQSVDEIVEDGQVLGHCFSIYPSGFVVVPNLKELPPIKLYSEEGRFQVDAEHGIP